MHGLSIGMLFQNIIFVCVVFAFMYVAKFLNDARTSGINENVAIEDESNFAVGLRQAGLCFGVAIAMQGILAGSTQGFMTDLKFLFVEGIVVVIAMFVTFFINDLIILRGIRNDDEVGSGNVAVATVEAGCFIGTGLILNGAFCGDGASLVSGIKSSLTFFALAQVAMIIMMLVYEWITPFKAVGEVRKDNRAAGIAIGGMIVAMSIILKSTVAGPSAGFWNDLGSFALFTGIGIGLLFIFRFLVDLMFLPNTNLRKEVEEDQNSAALIMTAGLLIAVATVLSTIV